MSDRDYLGANMPKRVDQLSPQQRKAMAAYFKFPQSITDDPRRLEANLHFRLQRHHIAAQAMADAKRAALEAEKKKAAEREDYDEKADDESDED